MCIRDRNNTLKTGLNLGDGNKLYEADEDNLTKDSPQILGVSWSSGKAPIFYAEGRAVVADPTTIQSGSLEGVEHLRLSHSDWSKDNWGGHMGEIIFYSDELSNEDRNKVESYLSLKYGTSLDQTTAQSYTASDGTEMWDKDFSGASTYNNDIAGIGRDDGSDLGQVKSCLLYTSPSPRDRTRSRMPSSA